MILRKKRPHLVFKTPLEVMGLLRFDVSHQRADVGGTDRKQPIPTLPRELFHALLLHPRRRSGFYLRHDFRRRSCRRQTQRQVNVIGHAPSPKTFTIQLPCRASQIRVQLAGNRIRDQWLRVFGAENDVHQVEAQSLRHAGDYMPGFQPSSCAAIGYLGLRPRLVCGRTYGPHMGAHLETANLVKQVGTTKHNHRWPASKASGLASLTEAQPPSSTISPHDFPHLQTSPEPSNLHHNLNLGCAQGWYRTGLWP
jgi:hypothetical protein